MAGTVEQNPVRAGLVGRVEDWPYHGTINDLMFYERIVKPLVNKSMEPARPHAACDPRKPTRSSSKSGPRAGRLHVEGYLRMYSLELW